MSHRRALELAAKMWVKTSLGETLIAAIPTLHGKPTVIAANHQSAVDSALAIMAMSAVTTEWYVQATAQMVERYGRFYGGAYLPVGNSSRVTAMDILRQRRILESSSDVIVWTYPQGDHMRAVESFEARSGIYALVRGLDVQVVGAGIRYEVFRGVRPHVAVAFDLVSSSEIDQRNIKPSVQRALLRAERLLDENLPARARKTFGE